MTSEPKRAVIYLRMSQDRKKDGEGIERQRQDCEDLVRAKGLRLIRDAIVDNDTSASRRKARPGWDQVVQLVQDGAIDAVVAWRTDRLYRHPLDLESIVRDVASKVTIYTVDSGEMDLSTATGRAVARVLTAIAAQEVELKAERQARALVVKAKRGLPHGGRRPLGYEFYHPDEALPMSDEAAHKRRPMKLRIQKEEAAILREAAGKLLSSESLREVTKWVNDELAKQVGRTNPIGPHVLKRVLQSPTLAGKRVHQTQANRREVARLKRDGGDWERAIVRKTSAADWDPIFTDDEQNQIIGEFLNRDLKAERSSITTAPRRGIRAPRTLLSGIVRCGRCGARMTHSTKMYQCNRQDRARDGGLGCGRVGISSQALKDLIEGMVHEVLLASPTSELQVGPAADLAALSALESRLAAAEEEFTRLVPLAAKGIFTEAQIVPYKERLDALRRQVEDERIHHAEVRADRHLFDVREGWEEADVETKAEVIRTLIKEIVVDPATTFGPRLDPRRVRITWN